MINIFAVTRLPREGPEMSFAAHALWPSEKILVVAEDFTGHSQAKQLALALAYFWGLPGQVSGPTEMLSSWQAPGTRLSPTDIERLRVTAQDSF